MGCWPEALHERTQPDEAQSLMTDGADCRSTHLYMCGFKFGCQAVRLCSLVIQLLPRGFRVTARLAQLQLQILSAGDRRKVKARGAAASAPGCKRVRSLQRN